MNLGIVNITNNIGMSFENVILMVLVLGSLIFMAKDFKLGLIILFLLSGCTFMWFYNAELNYVYSLVIMFSSIVMLSFTLYASSKTVQYGGFV